MFDIITIGTATRDAFFIGIPFVEISSRKFKTLKGVCLPFGSKVAVPKIVFTTGGAGTNAAVTFGRQELKTACVCRVGKDISGDAIVQELKDGGINTRFVQRDSQKSTAYSVIFLTPEGERTILTYKGAGEDLAEKEIPPPSLKTKWIFIDSLNGKERLLKKLLFWANRQGIKIASNPGTKELPILRRERYLLRYYDILIMNEEEASYLTGIPYSPRSHQAIFDRFDAWVNGIAVMTMGQKGAAVSDCRYRYQAGIFPEKKLVDRTGAGDAFGSGFVAAYLRTGDIAEAIRAGSANATSVVEYIGAKKGILKKSELNKGRWRQLKIKSTLI